MAGEGASTPRAGVQPRIARTRALAGSHLGGDTRRMPTSLQPELWVDRADAAVRFYESAFGATVLHLVGDGDQIVAQLAVEGAAFWVASADPDRGRFSPTAIGGRTSRTLLLVGDPDQVHAQAVRAGATATAPVSDEHGWRIGRVVDPFGHEWEIARPLGEWPPT